MAGLHAGFISVEERTESQAGEINPNDVVLDIGCGIAIGTALALRAFDPGAVYGLDLSRDQLDRVTRVNAELLTQQRDRFMLQQGSAWNSLIQMSTSTSVIR